MCCPQINFLNFNLSYLISKKCFACFQIGDGASESEAIWKSFKVFQTAIFKYRNLRVKVKNVNGINMILALFIGR